MTKEVGSHWGISASSIPIYIEDVGLRYIRKYELGCHIHNNCFTCPVPLKCSYDASKEARMRVKKRGIK